MDNKKLPLVDLEFVDKTKVCRSEIELMDKILKRFKDQKITQTFRYEIKCFVLQELLLMEEIGLTKDVSPDRIYVYINHTNERKIEVEQAHFKHDCFDCKFLGHKDGNDIYFCELYENFFLVFGEGEEDYKQLPNNESDLNDPDTDPLFKEAYKRYKDY